MLTYPHLTQNADTLGLQNDHLRKPSMKVSCRSLSVRTLTNRKPWIRNAHPKLPPTSCPVDVTSYAKLVTCVHSNCTQLTHMHLSRLATLHRKKQDFWSQQRTKRLHAPLCTSRKHPCYLMLYLSSGSFHFWFFIVICRSVALTNLQSNYSHGLHPHISRAF
jgi:hypothetical protein